MSSYENDIREITKGPSKFKQSLPAVASHHSFLSFHSYQEEQELCQSLQNVSANIKKFEDLVTLSEDMFRKERQMDRELYFREQQRQLNEKMGQQKWARSPSNYKVKQIPSPTVIKSPLKRQRRRRRCSKSKLKQKQKQNNNTLNPPPNCASPKRKNFKIYNFSPRRCRSRLYFRNGKIGCVDISTGQSTENLSNVQKTHAIVKSITENADIYPVTAALKRHSFAADTTSDFISEDSSISLDDIPHTRFNFESSLPDSDDPIPTDDLLDDEYNDMREHECKMKSLKLFDLEYGDVTTESNSDNNTDTPFHIEVNVINEQDLQDGRKSLSGESNLSSIDQAIKNQMRQLVRRFSSRTVKMRSQIELPPTPLSSNSLVAMEQAQINNETTSEQLPPPNGITNYSPFKADNQNIETGKPFSFSMLCGGKGSCDRKSGVLDPQGKFYISWLCIVSISFVYNAWVIPLRSTFPVHTADNLLIWMFLDYCVDAIYLVDVIFIKHRVMYLCDGFWVRDKELTRRHYMRTLKFKLDILGLCPLDLLYFILGTNATYVRAPRLLKIQSFWEVFRLLDRVISSPFIVRLGRTLSYMLYMIHITACAYYAYSDFLGIGSDRWVYSGIGHPYVRCFAFATKIATSIGKNPIPETNNEYLFMTGAWMTGVCVFAILIGQIRDSIATATKQQTEYRQLVDETVECMHRLNLPNDYIDRIKMWFKFTWEQQRSIDEQRILDYLPRNLRTDIAIAVHIQTLSKVELFADCEAALLRDLVLKLQSVTYLPGDYVCRKGEIGKEMYIVKWGHVLVMGGDNNDEVLATLSEGSVFGEISLLSINGVEGKRRTADVMSKGYANLFVLSKADLNEAIAEYPQAQAVLKRRAQSVMRRNALRERKKHSPNEKPEVVIANPKTPPPSPKLLEAVIRALPEKSQALQLLTRGSKRTQKRKLSNRSVTFSSAKNEILKECTEKDQVKSLSSPDLLSSVQKALQDQENFANLTDAEKAKLVREKIDDNRLFSKRNISRSENENVNGSIEIRSLPNFKENNEQDIEITRF